MRRDEETACGSVGWGESRAISAMADEGVVGMELREIGVKRGWRSVERRSGTDWGEIGVEKGSIAPTATFEAIIHTPQTIPRLLLRSRLGPSWSLDGVQV